MAFTLVFYYIPDDHDDQATPNAYVLQKNIADITQADIEAEFPLAKGKDASRLYHFRFKFSHQGDPIWIDLTDKKVKVPKFEN